MNGKSPDDQYDQHNEVNGHTRTYPYIQISQNGSKIAVEPVLLKCKFDPLHAGCWKKVFNEKVP